MASPSSPDVDHDASIIQAFASGMAIPCTHSTLSFCEVSDTDTGTVAYVVVHTAFASLLIPMLIIMFYFSSNKTRKSAVFVFAVLAVASGLLQGCQVLVSTVSRPPV
jgi:hypothetical protein